jgi:hypothetical protein
MKNFLIVFALITLAAVIAACEQKTVETNAPDAGAEKTDAAAPSADAAPAQPLAEVPVVEAMPASGPAEVGPAVVVLPTFQIPASESDN